MSQKTRSSACSRKNLYNIKLFTVLCLFTCGSSLVQQVTASDDDNDARFVYNKSKTDAAASAENTDTNVQLLDENETDPVSMKR